MDHDTDGDGAINLSTSQRPSASTTPNGDTPTYGQDQQENDQVIIFCYGFEFTKKRCLLHPYLETAADEIKCSTAPRKRG